MSKGQLESPWQWTVESEQKTFGTIAEDPSVLGTITYDPEHSGKVRRPYIVRMWEMSELGGLLVIAAPCKSIRGAKAYLAWFYRHSAWQAIKEEGEQ